MLRALLIRHAEHTLQDIVLVGRSPGVPLSAQGREQARTLAHALRNEDVAAIQSSRCERCVQTAEELSSVFGIPVEIEPALDEMDFGAWTGRQFAALENDPEWRSWNAFRSLGRPPGGESMAQAQQRILHHLERLAQRNIAARLAMVTHAEIIRAALLHQQGLPLDAWGTILVPTGSVSRMDFGGEPGCGVSACQSAAA